MDRSDRRRDAREIAVFLAALAVLLLAFFHETLLSSSILSPADVLLVSAGFRGVAPADYEPANRLLTDPVLQFEPWIAFSRESLRRGELPLWNPYAGCGAPFLANGQSAVFDAFQWINYLGDFPGSLALAAFARLLWAGLGMFLFAKDLGLRAWGRRLAGLSYPLCGFLVNWLLYPVANVAVWMPWVFLATSRLVDAPGRVSVGLASLAVGGCLLGGHIQTSAHVLLASTAFGMWRIVRERRFSRLPACLLAGVMGVGLAAIEIIPLGFYLSRSPVWSDREAERLPPWRLARPRIGEAVCVALPLAFGGQRRGLPNLAGALGIDNVNEAAGGFVGLATLLWLVPAGLRFRKPGSSAVFLAWLGGVGLLGSLALPPVDNILRALPVLGVTDNRRLSLWFAFAAILLAGRGIDRFGAAVRRVSFERLAKLSFAAGAGCALVALSVPLVAPSFRERATAHYRRALADSPSADPGLAEARANRQSANFSRFLPSYYGSRAVILVFAPILFRRARRRTLLKPCLLLLGVGDLFLTGYGANSAVSLDVFRARPSYLGELEKLNLSGGRVLGLGEELLPNAAMRYGLRDVRNYDSIELSNSLAWFAPLYSPDSKRSDSRRDVTWERLISARDRLEAAGVSAIVSADRPNLDSGLETLRVGSAWVTKLRPDAYVKSDSGENIDVDYQAPGKLTLRLDPSKRIRQIFIQETYVPGWVAESGGRSMSARPGQGPFLAIDPPEGAEFVRLRYDPPEVRHALKASLFFGLATLFALTPIRPFRSTRIIDSRLGRKRSGGVESNP